MSSTILTRIKRRWIERWDTLYDAERRRLRLVALILLVIGLGWAGFRLLRDPIRQWRGEQALEQANLYLHQQDYRNALLALKRATMLTPSDPSTWRVVAHHLDELGMPEALVAHENILQLNPDDAAQRLLLAKRALQYDNPGLAEKTLSKLPSEGITGEEYHRLAAALSLSTGRMREYSEHLRALLEINPTDPNARFNLAVIALRADDPAGQAGSREELVRLLSVPPVRIRAALELLKDAARRRDASAATRVALEIDEAFPTPDALSNQPPGWDRLRGKLKVAATTSADVALLARWLGEIGLSEESLDWIDQQPAGIQSAVNVRTAAISLSVMSRNAPQFARLLSTGVWGELSGRIEESLVVVIRASSGDGGGAGAVRTAWLGAFSAAGDSPAGLRALARLALISRNAEETERALKALVRLSPNDQWAYQNLRTYYADQGQTLKLWELYRDWRLAEPDNPQLASRWWLLSAVLNRLPANAGMEVGKLVDRYPQNAEVIAAAAAVLWRQDSVRPAYELLTGLTDEVRGRPEIAFWMGVVGAQVDKRRAIKSLKLARGYDWLPEERAILESALGDSGGLEEGIFYQ